MEIIKKDDKHSKLYFDEEELAALEKVADLLDDVFWACDKGFALQCNGKPLFNEEQVCDLRLRLFRMSKYRVKITEGEQE